MISLGNRQIKIQRYVAFLGNIDVGKDRLLMEDLRGALRYGDFADVETVVASGNVLFTHEPAPSDGLAEKMAWIIREEFDIDCFVTVLTRAELAAAIAANPFAEDGDETKVHTLFLPAQPGEHQARALILDHAERGNERIAVGDRCLHIDYVDGVGTGA
ncbi:MAG: DUF1697 domain-containing protein [Pontixanthobacter sp.]